MRLSLRPLHGCSPTHSRCNVAGAELGSGGEPMTRRTGTTGLRMAAARVAVVLAAVTLSTGVAFGSGNGASSAAFATESGAGTVRVSPSCPIPESLLAAGPLFPVSVIEQNLGAARVYGESQPDAYSGYGAQWLGGTGSQGVVFVAFTGELERHAAALSQLVSNPNAVVACRSRVSEKESNRIVAEIQAGGNLIANKTINGVDVQLRGNEEATAAQLRAKYADKVTITVGHFSYPEKTLTYDCGVVPPTVSSKLLVLAKTVPVRVRSGDSSELSFRVTVRSRKGVAWSGGGEAVVTRPGQRIVVARSIGANGLGLRFGSLKYKSTASVDSYFSTDSCDASLGFVLPKGRYELHYPAAIREYPAPIPSGPPNAAMPPIPLIVTE